MSQIVAITIWFWSIDGADCWLFLFQMLVKLLNSLKYIWWKHVKWEVYSCSQILWSNKSSSNECLENVCEGLHTQIDHFMIIRLPFPFLIIFLWKIIIETKWLSRLLICRVFIFKPFTKTTVVFRDFIWENHAWLIVKKRNFVIIYRKKLIIKLNTKKIIRGQEFLNVI